VNEDLARLTADALKMRLTEAAGKMTEGFQSIDRSRLRKIAEAAADWWLDLVCEQASNEFDNYVRPPLLTA